MRTQINFRISEEEKSRWEKAASKSKLPLGTWIKNALNAASGRAKPKVDEGIRFEAPADPQHVEPPDPEPDRTESETSSPAPDASIGRVGEGDRPVKKGKTCDHGVKKGYYCWQCKGKAIVK